MILKSHEAEPEEMSHQGYLRNEDGGWGQSSESRMLEIEISEVSH